MRNLQPRGGQTNSAAGTVYDPAGARRWKLQRAAQGLLAEKTERIDRFGDARPHFRYRVAMCHRGTDGGAPTIKRSPDRLHARYAGLQTCGSVWHCAICAPKVAAARRDEMNLAIAAHVKAGGEVYLVTYTMQHDAARFGQGQLAAELDALAPALSSLKGSRAFRDRMEGVAALGTIRALETTYGEMNGWHCHTHELVFAGPDCLPMLRRIRGLWARQLIKRGLAGLQPGDVGLDKFRKLRALLRRCFDVQPGADAAAYVAKFAREPENERGAWGIASEMTRAHMKRGRADDGDTFSPQRCSHAAPGGLLNDYMDGDARSGDLWREFAVTFQGKRQLFWSRGLRQHFFGIVERSDEEIAATPDQRCTEHVIEIGPLAWARVIAHDARFELLRVAAERGADGVTEFLQQLATAPPSHSSDYTEGRGVYLRRVA